MRNQHELAAELRDGGEGLWSSVECEVRRDRVVVYARLVVHAGTDIATALARSERVLNDVMTRRLDGDGWLAAVQWSERLCKTFRPESAAEPAGAH